MERELQQRERRPRLVRIMDLAERGAYYGVALFLLATIVMVFVSAAITLADVVELGPLETALEVLD